MAIYETIFIMDSLVPPKEIDSAVERFSNIIKEKSGTVRKIEKWGKKRMSYEIQKKQYGFYVSIEFEGNGNIPKDLQSEYNFNDKVLRYLTYIFDKNKLKVMEQKAERREAEKVEKVEKVEKSAAPEKTENAEVKEVINESENNPAEGENEK
ncbi:MAG: 30S ribosomal protein S6 [Calditrichaceae bacterium]